MKTNESDREPSRRGLMGAALWTGGAMALGSQVAVATGEEGREGPWPPGKDWSAARDLPPGQPGADYTPVVTPNGGTLPWRVVGGVKVMHLVAEEVDHEFTPGLRAKCWGYNGRVHGPTIEAVEGDRVRIYVTNRLAASTTVHWHGLLIPCGMDGVGGLTQKAILPGETYKYEFTLRQHGTFMYHSHHDEMTQTAMGLMGMIVIHPRGVSGAERPDRDFVLLSSEWKIVPGTSRPDPNEMKDFNILTFNGRVYPGTEPLVVKKGQRVQLRIGNLSAMDHHAIHLHGHSFKIVATDGGEVPVAAQWPEVTAIVATGQTRTLRFIADNPGDWSLHCHMSHHVMNQMGHGVPNLIGVRTEGHDEAVRKLLPQYMTMGQSGMGDMGDMGMAVPENSIPMLGGHGPHDVITMGGMFTILKVRDDITSFEDPGWYEKPAGTMATVATTDDLRADGIDPARVGTRPAADAPPPAPVESTPATAPAVLYTCSMHPQIIRPAPGKCPICGMPLIVKK